MRLAARAAAVGLDPWRVLDAGADPDELAITEQLVTQLEANAIAKVQAQANATAYRFTEGVLGVLELLGLVTRNNDG
jgi:hypothetical protein